MLIWKVMRLLFLIPTLLVVGACTKPSFEPVAPAEGRQLEREIQELIESKLALARADPSDARAHATLGLVYEANELWVESAQCFANAIAIDDSQPVWLFHKSLVLREGGSTEDANAALREAGRRMPTDAAVQQRLGHLLLQLGEVPDARIAFERALAVAPDKPECMAGLAAVENAAGNWNAALDLAQRALSIDPSFQTAAYAAGLALQGLGRDEEARRSLAAGVGAQPRWMWDPLTSEVFAYRLTTTGLLAKANHAFGSGDYASAARIYETLVKRKPKDPEILNNLAACQIELGELDRAEKILEITLRLDAESFAAHLNMAELALKRGDAVNARKHADQAVDQGGGMARARFVRARVMMLQGDLEGADRDLQAAARIDPRNLQCFVLLTEVAIKRNRLDEARAWCRKVLELDASLVAARINLGVLALRAGDVAEARSVLAVLEKQAPSNPRTISLREEIERLGR